MPHTTIWKAFIWALTHKLAEREGCEHSMFFAFSYGYNGIVSESCLAAARNSKSFARPRFYGILLLISTIL